MARWWRRAVRSGVAYPLGVGLLTTLAWGPFVLADLGHLDPATPLALIGLVGPPLAGLNLATGFNETSLALANTWTAWSLVLIASLVYYTVFLTPAGLIILTAKRAAASSSTHSLWWGWQGVHLAAHAVLSVYAIRIFLG